jgi:hypothetical protein
MYPTVTPINALKESADESSFCNNTGSFTFLWCSGIVMAFVGEGRARLSALQVSGVADTDGDTDTGSVPEPIAERHTHAGA